MSDSLLDTAPDLSAPAGPPAHARIETWLTELIVDGRLSPGDRLPKEKDLAARLGVSRMTLRQALASLEARGAVERIPGRRGGTFINEPKIEVDITGLAGFTEQLRRAHQRAEASVVSADVVAASGSVSDALDLPSEATVYEIVRVRSAHREPLALERSYLPAEILPGLLDHPLTGSLYALLGREYGVAPQTATEVLEPRIASDTEARLLGVDTGTPLLLIERTAASADGRPIEYARDLFRPDRVRISVRTTAGTG